MHHCFSNLPFYLVYIAAFLPWVVASTNTTIIVHAFNATPILLSATLLLISPNTRLRFRKSTYLFFLLWGFYYFFILMEGKQVASIGLLSLVLLTCSFAVLLDTPSVTAGKLLRQLTSIYALHVIFIICELLTIYFGYRDIFVNLSNDRYKSNSIGFSRQIGLELDYGASSLLLQSQAAGHLVMSAFLFVYLALPRSNKLRSWCLLVFLFALFLLVITYTTFVIFAILLCVIWLAHNRLNYKSIAFIVTLASLAVFFSDYLISILFYKFSSGPGAFDRAFYEFHLRLWMEPLEKFRQLGSLEQLFGAGRVLAEISILESGDFGIGVLLFSSGLYLVILLMVTASVLLVTGSVYYQRYRYSHYSEVNAWVPVLMFNVIASLAWVLSMSHYTIAVQEGGLHLFAFNLAIVITAVSRLRKGRKGILLARHGRAPRVVLPPRSSAVTL